MKFRLRQLLSTLEGESRPRIVVRRNGIRSEGLHPLEVSHLNVESLQDHSVEIFGAPLVTMKTPKGHFGLYRGEVKVTRIVPGSLEAHHYLREAYQQAVKITGRSS